MIVAPPVARWSAPGQTVGTSWVPCGVRNAPGTIPGDTGADPHARESDDDAGGGPDAPTTMTTTAGARAPGMRLWPGARAPGMRLWPGARAPGMRLWPGAL